jgi:Tfp pilus assembly protein PilV
MRLLHPRAPRNTCGNDAFSLLEVIIALLLVVLIGSSAAATIREGIDTMQGTEDAGRAISAISELQQFTVEMSLAEVDALNGQMIAPIMGNGDPLPGSDGLLMSITVTVVDDADPLLPTLAILSGTRRVDVNVANDTQVLEAASWLVTDH